MNEKRPEFALPKQSYSKKPDPYRTAPSCHVNLLEPSRYARKEGKRLAELTEEEIQKFKI